MKQMSQKFNDADTTLVDGTTLQKVGDVINQTIALVLFIFAYRKQTNYIRNRVEKASSHK